MGAFVEFQRKQLNEICEEDLQALVEARISESLYIDGDWIAEVLKDITGMANAQGGDVVVGVATDDHCASRIVPLTDGDSFYKKVVDIALTSIQPRINGLDARPVPVKGGHVVIIRVPNSHNRPHIAVWKESQLIAGKRLNERRTASLSGDEIHSMVLESNAEKRTIPKQLSRIKKWVEANTIEVTRGGLPSPSHRFWCCIIPHNIRSNYWLSERGAIQKETGDTFLEQARMKLRDRIHRRNYFMASVDWNWTNMYCRPDRNGYVMPMRSEYGFAIRVDDNGTLAINQLIQENKQEAYAHENEFVYAILQLLDYGVALHSVRRLPNPLVDVIAGFTITSSYVKSVLMNHQKFQTPIEFEENVSGLLVERRKSIPWNLLECLHYTLGFHGVTGPSKEILMDYATQDSSSPQEAIQG